MSKPFFIVGPTAIGKSRLAVEVAERTGVEIVSADAFQIYAGLDILTAKPSGEELRRARHHLVGHVPLSQTYNVARFLSDAQERLRSIAGRGRAAMVVGGTGLYIKALTHGLSPLPPAQPELRARLEPLDCEALLARLAELDPKAAAVIDTRNKRRLVRALEVCLTTGQPFSDFLSLWQTEAPACAGVFLTCGRAALHARIERRTREMFAQGVVEEVRAVPPEDFSATSAQMIGHSEIRAYLAGQTSVQECQDRMAAATRHYAKRQLTWFRAASALISLDLANFSGLSPLAEAVARRLQAHLDAD